MDKLIGLLTVFMDRIDDVKGEVDVAKQRLLEFKSNQAVYKLGLPLLGLLSVVYLVFFFSFSVVAYLVVVVVGSCILAVIVFLWLSLTFSTFFFGLLAAATLLCPWFLVYHLFKGNYLWF